MNTPITSPETSASQVMQMIKKLTRIIQRILIVLFLTFCLNIDAAHARGGCFAGNTTILTPTGYRYIKDLNRSDHIIGFNTFAHQNEEETIGDIQVINSPDYYLINSTIKVTGTHPFYVQQGNKLNLVEVHKLRLNDKLLGQNDTQIAIDKIEHINAPLKVYNLLSITPDHNFYAGGILVHNKGGGGGGGGGGGSYSYSSSGRYGYGSGGSRTFTTSPISILEPFTILLLALLPIAFFREIWNFVRFWRKEFTDKLELIDFTKNIASVFSNSYSVRYSNDDEFWLKISPPAELEELKYQNFISKDELVKKTNDLFLKYQNDWTNKSFDNMKDYVTQYFHEKQYNIFTRSFGEGFDIVYNPTIQEIVPTGYIQEADKHIFQIHIIAEAVNFSLSEQGSVLSGENSPRPFTEQWEIGVDDDKNCYLIDIAQVFKTSS
jgi:uncharacterized membrane protein YgcG